ncbi:hypothetical protein [Pseudomonas sp. lyk4-TYG-107]|uniref:hypothetical protein n=1 Tax=Pseudomonas sp. lyk4-TYG-107 TaxID=3040317 RepID=UPI002554CEF4|nr:hypothetical protein [Pseudomonas sp. lyk4-TYG-107]
MNAAENITAIFEQCMADSNNPRQKESLRRIHKACEYLQQQDIRITPSQVERYCIDHDWDGPKAQSIRNSPALSKYLTLRKSGQVIRTNKASRPIPLIADETLRAYVNLLTEERDQAIADKARIVKGLRNIPGIPVDDLIRQGFGGKPSPAKHEEFRLPPLMIEALGRLFDEQRLSDCGLKLYRERLVHTLTGNVLLEKRHVEAIHALGQARSVHEATSSFPGIGAEKASTIEHKE